MVVFTEDADEYRTLADDIAADREERVVTEFQRLPDTDEPIIYVDDPSSICEEYLLELQRRLLSSDGERRFGVVTGHTVEDARALSGATPRDSSEHVLTLRSEPDAIPDDPGQEVLVGEDLTADALGEATDGVESLSIQSGGWTMHLFLDDGFVCGVPESQPIDGGEDQPYCVADGAMDCPLSGDLVRAEALDADHVFVSSCASMIDNSSTGVPVHVGLGLLDGARSLVGSYRVGPSLPQEALLHYSLVRDGYDLAERCYLLNSNSHACGIQAYPYVPFGRPDAASTAARDPKFNVEVESDADGTRLRLTDLDAHVVDVTLPGIERPGETHYVRNVTEGYEGPPLYYAAFEEGDSLRVLAYAGQRLRPDELDLRVTTRPTNETARLRLQDALVTATDHRRLGVYDGTLSKTITDLQNRIRGFADDLNPERYDAEFHRAPDDAVTESVEQLESVREQLLDAVTDCRFLTSLYGSNATEAATFVTDATCSVCDTRIFVNQVADFTGTAGRQIGECPHCGPIFDVPAGEPGTCPNHPTIRIEDVAGSAEATRLLTVEFTNEAAAPVTATAAPSVLSPGPEADQPLLEPSRKEQTLEPGEEASFEFALDTRSLVPAEYSVRAVVLSNLRVYESRRQIQVGSVTGQIPFFRT